MGVRRWGQHTTDEQSEQYHVHAIFLGVHCCPGTAGDRCTQQCTSDTRSAILPSAAKAESPKQRHCVTTLFDTHHQCSTARDRYFVKVGFVSMSSHRSAAEVMHFQQRHCDTTFFSTCCCCGA